MLNRRKSLLLFLASFVPGVISGQVTWEELEVNLPMPVSDISATYDEATDRIYLIGGCDDPQGNSQLTPTLFVCSSITAKGFAFNPNDFTFENLPDAPRERYRHSASNVNGKIWLVGGRTVSDVVIPEIDVSTNDTNMNYCNRILDVFRICIKIVCTYFTSIKSKGLRSCRENLVNHWILAT